MRHARLAVMTSYTLCLSLLLCACASEQDEERIPQLKKQAKSFQAKLEVRPQGEALDPQAKCATDALVWFSVNWRRDKNTFLLDSSSHYSKSVNKCFVLVQHNQILTADHVSKTVTVHEVYENIERASVRLTRQRSENDEKAAATCTIDGDKKDTISFQACVNLIYSSFMTN
jgi:hypothetical protein